MADFVTSSTEDEGDFVDAPSAPDAGENENVGADTDGVAVSFGGLQVSEDSVPTTISEGVYEEVVEGPELVYEKDFEKALAAKEEGNDFFRSKEYDDALESYSRAIALCPEDDEHKDTLATFYGNRSAAYSSIEEHELVVEDCTYALDLKPDYVKVIARRMLAQEKLEHFEEALADAKLVQDNDPSYPKISDKM